MPTIFGIGVAAMVAIIARLAGLDRDRAFYPAVTIVIASYYVLFAVMAGASANLPIELVMFGLFSGTAIWGFRISLWFVVAALGIHGIFDFARPMFLDGRGVPQWWPTFCLAFDVVAALWLAGLLLSEKRAPESGRPRSAQDR